MLLLLPSIIMPARATTDTIPPVWPVNSKITALSITSSSIYISWTPATDDSGTVNYRVYENGEWNGMYTLSTSYGRSSLAPNETITFLIVAEDPSHNNSTGPSATFTTAPSQCTGYEACLVSFFTFSPTSVQGGIMTVTGKVGNEGQDSIRVDSMTVTSDIGAYSLTSATPLLLRVGEIGTNGLAISVPADERVGTHLLVFTISWEYNSTVSGWRQGDSIVQNSAFSVTSGQTPNQPNSAALKSLIGSLASYLYLAVGIYLALVSLAVGLVIRNDRRKRFAMVNHSP